ncbi:hypothetical protein GJ744_009100 [Endocarpon pusillum]|uniref:Major facilitator superfamily (MFS) profile domain-containing protein n=1 Tax=Endocarpon pusillum TaxID=364733 RepID=A0A8H7AK85_9EURO|nr:hypothetical protein GJ744_009100 [Endocarpon pusillum]
MEPNAGITKKGSELDGRISSLISDKHDPETLEIDAVAEKKLIRKLDLYIVPMVMLLYLLSFLDRVNIGNALLYGMKEDLSLTGPRFQVAVSILFVTYILSELPSNLVLKRFRPSRWIAFITTGWGIVATLQGVVQSYGGLIATRLMMGALEGGLFPGMAVYLTLFYTKTELALRIGYLFVSAALAGGVGGLLAYAIGNMDGVAGQSGWRWIFILEGLPTFLLGISCWWLLADDPETAFYLKAEEKALMLRRKQRQTGYTIAGDRMHKEDVVKGLKDWKIWMFCLGQFGVDTVLYGYSTFLPTIIRGIGHWNAAQTQALTVPCYALGAIVYLLVARLSDRQQKRGIYTVIFGAVTAIGYGVLISDTTSAGHYAGCFLVAVGLYVVAGLPLSWLPSNQPRYGKRTTAVGMQLTIGNLSGIMAPFLYENRDGPRYIKGHAVTLGMVAFASILYGYMWFYFARRNSRRSIGLEDKKIEGKTEQEAAEMGDESPRFVFTI